MIHRPTEADYDEIRKLGAKLHIPTPEMFWGFKVEDPAGNVLHEHEERGHSWVRNAYNMLVSQFCGVNCTGTSTFGAGNLNVKNVSGVIAGSTTASIALTGGGGSIEGSNAYGFWGPVATSSAGIVVGTGSKAFDFEQYQLASLVAHGTTSGTLSYAVSNAITKAYDSNTKKYSATHSRYLTNNSGASIIVAEVGIYSTLTSGSNNNTMLVRDVLETPVTVANIARLTVTYNISVTYPS